MSEHSKTWLQSDFQQRRLSGAPITSLRRKTARWLGAWLCAGMLLGLVTLSTACTTLPPPPCETQPLPTAPALTEPTPSETFSEAARRYFKTWREKLTALPQTDKP